MNNPFDKSDIAIDLTSLLDVIFIVLLIVMCSQNLTAETREQEAETREQEAAEATMDAEKTKELYSQHMEKYEETDRFVLFIDVSAAITDSQKPSERRVRVLSGVEEAGEAPYELTLTPANDSARYEELHKYLDGKIKDYGGGGPEGDEGAKRPVILTVNKGDEDILYRDEMSIELIFQKLREDYDFVY